MRMAAWFVFVVLAGQAVEHAAGQHAHFRDVPSVVTSDREFFRELMRRGHCGTVRALMLGDSQEMSPGGSGTVYIARLNYELWLRFGNVPETGYFPMNATTGGVPPAEWMVRQAAVEPNAGGTRLDWAMLLPNTYGAATSTTSGSRANPGQEFGQLVLLQHDAASADPGAELPRFKYFERGDGVDLELYAATNESSGEVRVRVTPAPTPQPGYYYPTTQVLESSMGLEREGPARVVSQVLGPIHTAPSGYTQVEIYGTDTHKLTDILGGRFISRADRRGWSLTSMARSGYNAGSVLEHHALSGAMLAALRPDVVFVSYGSNDTGRGRTPEQFHDLLVPLIQFVREAAGENVAFVLLTETTQFGLSEEEQDALDRYPGATASLALELPRVAAVNSRGLVDARGWNQSTLYDFTTDGVHHNPAGAALKAQVEIAALYDEFVGGDGACAADVNADCGVTIDDLIVYIERWTAGHSLADLDDGSGTGTPDQGVTIEDLVFFLTRYQNGC